MTRLEKIQRLNAIAADYEKGMSLPALAEKYGVCVRTCYRAIDKDAVKERTTALNKETMLDAKILNDYATNMSVSDIAAKNRTTPTRCYRIAKEAGLCSLEQGRNRRSSRRMLSEIGERLQTVPSQTASGTMSSCASQKSQRKAKTRTTSKMSSLTTTPTPL